MAFCSCIY